MRLSAASAACKATLVGHGDVGADAVVDGSDAVEDGARQLAEADLALVEEVVCLGDRQVVELRQRRLLVQHRAHAQVAIVLQGRVCEHLVRRQRGRARPRAMTLSSGNVWVVGSTPVVSMLPSTSKCSRMVESCSGTSRRRRPSGRCGPGARRAGLLRG